MLTPNLPYNLSSVKPGLFGSVVNMLEFACLGTNITSKHIQALFTAMSQNCQLKSLNLSGKNLSYVEPSWKFWTWAIPTLPINKHTLSLFGTFWIFFQLLWD